jgi:flagellar biosynthesis protein
MAEEPKKAVALKYNKEAGDSVPKVVAKGKGEVAQKILELAEQAGVPIRQDSDLVEILSKLEINTEIPPDTYVIVAEILAWVYKLKNKS